MNNYLGACLEVLCTVSGFLSAELGFHIHLSISWLQLHNSQVALSIEEYLNAVAEDIVLYFLDSRMLSKVGFMWYN